MQKNAGLKQSGHTQQPLRLYAVIMILLTAGYLIMELAFNASLLDVAGQGASPDEVDHVETFGRCISAVAVILALFGTLLKNWFRGRTSTMGLIFKTGIMAAIVFPMIFFGEQTLIDSLAKRSNGAQRRNAYWMALMGKSLLNGEIDLDGVTIGTGENRRPEGKAFVALLPFWGSTIKDVCQKAGQVMPFVAKKTAVRAIGQPENFYKKVYLASLQQIHDLYNNKYVPGSNAYARTVAGASKQADRAWNEYKEALIINGGYTPNNIPWLLRSKVRRMVQKRGVPVPKNWHPADRGTFRRVVANQVKEKAKVYFNQGVRRALGKKASLAPGLSWPLFIKSAAIRRVWHDKTHIPETVALADNFVFAEFQQKVYWPTVEILAKQIEKQLHDATEQFETSGTNEQRGKDAYRAVIVPPIALGFSMLGGIVHLAKLLNYLLMLAIPPCRKNMRLALVVGTLLVLLLAPMATSNAITSSRLVTNLKAGTASPLHKLRGTGLVWIVKAQTIFYPMNSSIRDYFLGGYDFRA